MPALLTRMSRPPKRAAIGRDHRLIASRVGDVERPGLGGEAAVDEVVGHRLARPRRSMSVHRHVGALGGEHLGGGAAHAASRRR